MVPPRMDRYESGISNLVAATPNALARRFTMGIMTSTTGVLFMNAEAASVPMPISATASRGFRRVRRMIQPEISSSVPVRSKAPDKTNIAAIVIGAEFENTPSSSSVDRKPNRNITSPPTAANTTGGRRSSMKPTNRMIRSASPICGWKAISESGSNAGIRDTASGKPRLAKQNNHAGMRKSRQEMYRSD